FFLTTPLCTAIQTLSLHDALPISSSVVQPPLQPTDEPAPARAADRSVGGSGGMRAPATARPGTMLAPGPGAGADGARTRARILRDRKSTRLNSSHVSISYAVFCLK